MAKTIKLLSLLILLSCICASLFAAQSGGENKTSAIAVFPKNFPPQYQLSPEGEPYGYGIEVMKEVAQRTEVNIQYIAVDSWQDVWSMVKAGKADIVPNMGISQERSQYVFYTKPYESFAISIFVNKGTKGIASLEDLKGKRVGTPKTNVANSLVGGLVPLIHHDSAKQSMQALIAGKLDAVILPDVVGFRVAAKLTDFDQIVTVGLPIAVIERAIAVSKNRPQLFRKINKAMDGYLVSDEFVDTQQSWGRDWEQGLSEAQLVKLNIGIALVLLIGLGGLIRFKFMPYDKASELDSPVEWRVISLVGILFIATVITSIASLWFLYDAAFEGQKSRLMNIAQSRARIIESVTRFNLLDRKQLGLSVEQSFKNTLKQVRQSHESFIGFGQTGEFTFAKRIDDEIVFFLQQRHAVTVKPKNIPWKSPDAEPMRRALSGRSGTLVGLDYRGVEVLAAHEPVAILNAGIVAKIDLAEIRQPYVRVALIICAITMGILAIGIVLFYSLTKPILRTLVQSHARLRAIIDHSPSLISITDASGHSVISSPQLEELVSGLPSEGEACVEHKDGSVHTYISSVFPLSEGRKSFGSCQISTDITDRVASEAERRQLAMAFQSTSEAVVITDINGNILTINRAFEEITGYTSDEVIGRNPSLLQSGRHDSKFYQQMWKAISITGGWRGEIWNRRKNGEVYPEWINISTVHDNEGKPSCYVAVCSDITKQKQSQDKLYYLAYHDPLTKLPNRLLFRDRLEYFLRLAHRENKFVALFAIDLDRFKNINDSLGHPVGDKVLREAASRLQNLVRESDTVARMGGDEFTVIADGFNDYHSVSILANKIVEGMSCHFDLGERQVVSTISLGIAVYPQDGQSYEELLKNADSALYKAKDLGRNNYQYYTEELGKRALEKLEMENQILHGIKHGEFVLFYQPQFEVQTGALVSAEALVRWQHPELGLLGPDRFIPLAEETGLIVPLGEWILKTACEQAKQWLDEGHNLQRIAVNLSGSQIERSGLFEMIKSTLALTQLPAHKLELEITEGFIMGEVKESIHLLESISALGITIAIDDFGTGYSSLAYLKRLPVTTLKIDRSFIQDLPEDNEDAEIARAIIALGHSLGMTIVAEGVENQAHWSFLKSEGCDLMQGYLMCRPISAQTFSKNYFTTASD